MPRLMSFAKTVEQVRRQAKTVTRRLGWDDLEIGEVLWAVEKAQGLTKGEKVQRICKIRVVSVRKEPLCLVTKEDVIAEGFPELSTEDFIAMFLELSGGKCDRCTNVNRIEFEYLLDLEAIQDRCRAASPGPWWWSYSYGVPNHWDEIETHWCLVSPASEADDRCIAWELVTAHTGETDLYGARCDQLADYQFIAHARADVPALLAEVKRLLDEIGRLDRELCDLREL